MLMYNTDIGHARPDQLGRRLRPGRGRAYAGKITAYDGPIYIADAALYLKAHKPELGITDPYELTQPQFDAAVELLKEQRPFVGKYWSAVRRRDRQLHQRHDRRRHDLAVPGQHPRGAASRSAGRPHRGDDRLGGHLDAVAKAQHPNCMLKWMAWMLTPEVQAQVAEYFGEAPANPKACQYLDASYGPTSSRTSAPLTTSTTSFYNAIAFWKTPLPDCGDDRGADVHRLLGLDPRMDGDQGLSPDPVAGSGRWPARRSSTRSPAVAMTTARRLPTRAAAACGGACRVHLPPSLARSSLLLLDAAGRLVRRSSTSARWRALRRRRSGTSTR